MGVNKIVIAGAGPAGMMAAIRAGQLKQQAVLLEKNSLLGKKLLLSGKGRCNLTNACDLESFLERFFNNGQFLRDAFKKFFNLQLMDFFRQRGVELKVERQLRVFPESDDSLSILKALKEELRLLKVEVLYKTAMKDILIRQGEARGIFTDAGHLIPADKVILATGGVSYPFTGSSGEGLGIAQRLGHTIVPFKPGLVPLEVRQKYPRLLKGLTLKNIRLTFESADKRIVSDIGELLFTHFGISGPLVLSYSARMYDWLSLGQGVCAYIDLKPALSKEQLDLRLLREFNVSPKASIKNSLNKLLPKRMTEVFLQILNIPPQTKANQVTQKQRAGISGMLKDFRLDISRCRPIEEAMVTRGGISLKEIDPRTMQSRLIKGLYFAGEIIDIAADTGGFNLQAAFSTGYLAGESAAL